MKIIGGTLRGRNFYLPKDLRVTQNLARKALFDILGQELTGVHFLDLFSGSGAIAFEALSRGAEFVQMIEKDPKCYEVIHENASLLEIRSYIDDAQRFDVFNMDAFAAIKHLAEKKQQFHVVFLDPPYCSGLTKKALKTLEAYDILHRNYIIVVQHDMKEKLPEQQGSFFLSQQRKYGKTLLSFYSEKT